MNWIVQILWCLLLLSYIVLLFLAIKDTIHTITCWVAKEPE